VSTSNPTKYTSVEPDVNVDEVEDAFSGDEDAFSGDEDKEGGAYM
jgi:hypothetical protein